MGAQAHRRNFGSTEHVARASARATCLPEAQIYLSDYMPLGWVGGGADRGLDKSPDSPSGLVNDGCTSQIQAIQMPNAAVRSDRTY